MYSGLSNVDKVAWGLYDMTGSICDWGVGYPQNASVDSFGTSNGSFRVDRGGSWGGGPQGYRI